MGLGKDDIGGIYPSMATPFDEQGEIQLPLFLSELEHLERIGVAGVAVGGSTGEGFALTADELSLLWRTAVERVGGRLPVIAGIIATTAREGQRRAQLAAEAGVDLLMVTPPIYQHPSPRGLYDYFESLWRASDLPLMIYNVVKHVPVTPAVLRDLVEIPGLVAMKESLGGGLDALSEMIETVGDRISVTWAHDPLLYPGLALGATASISGICVVAPTRCMAMYDAVQRNDAAAAREIHYQLQPLMRAMGADNWASKTKACLRLQGRECGYARRPFLPVEDDVREQLRDALVAAQIEVVASA